MVADYRWFILDENIDETLGDVVLETLDRLMMSSFEELIKTSGRVEALSALKPYLKASMYGQIQEISKLLNIEGNGPDAILLIWKVAQSWLIPPKNIVGVITEKGAVETIKECPCSGGSPDICIYFSHFGTEALCEIVNPDYECVITHHLTNNDPQCRFVFKKRSDPITVLEDPGRTLAALPPIEFTKEQAYAMHLAGGSACLHVVASAFADIHGSEQATRAHSKNAKEIGHEMGKKLLESNPKIGGSEDSAMRLVDSLCKLILQQGVCRKGPNNEFEKEITSCSFQTWTKEVCQQFEALIKGMLESIDPSYEFAYDRMISKGDKTCHWTIRKKVEELTNVEPVASENKTEEQVAEDPIRLLALMLAKGEIDEEEFERKMELLRKHKVAP